jgi:hypothetical protein
MAEISKREIKEFLMQGTLTGKLATVRRIKVLTSFRFGSCWMKTITEAE